MVSRETPVAAAPVQAPVQARRARPPRRCRSRGWRRSSVRPAAGPAPSEATSSSAASVGVPRARRTGIAPGRGPNAAPSTRQRGAPSARCRAGTAPPSSTPRSRCRRGPARVSAGRPAGGGSGVATSGGRVWRRCRSVVSETTGFVASNSPVAPRSGRATAGGRVSAGRVGQVRPPHPGRDPAGRRGRSQSATRCSRGDGRLNNPSQPRRPRRKVSAR